MIAFEKTADYTLKTSKLSLLQPTDYQSTSLTLFRHHSELVQSRFKHCSIPAE